MLTSSSVSYLHTETGEADMNYETPVGSFKTWEEAATACERCDLDPCACIKYVGGAL